METTLREVAVENLRTSYASLRSKVPSKGDGLSSLPIRVVASEKESGRFEVVDGFKRLRAVRDGGTGRLPVIVEQARGVQVKALILRCNAPKRTVTAMDEARVVRSLVEEDRLTVSAAAKVLGRKRPWVSKRYALARRLARQLHKAVDKGRLPVSLAYKLSALSGKDQAALAAGIMKAGLSVSDGLALICTYRSLEDEAARRALLRDPIGALEGYCRRQASLNLSAGASGRLDRYRRLSGLLEEFGSEKSAEVISPAEARLLDAERRRLEAQIVTCAHSLSGRSTHGEDRQSTIQEEEQSYEGSHNAQGPEHLHTVGVDEAPQPLASDDSPGCSPGTPRRDQLTSSYKAPVRTAVACETAGGDVFGKEGLQDGSGHGAGDPAPLQEGPGQEGHCPKTRHEREDDTPVHYGSFERSRSTGRRGCSSGTPRGKACAVLRAHRGKGVSGADRQPDTQGDPISRIHRGAHDTS